MRRKAVVLFLLQETRRSGFMPFLRRQTRRTSTGGRSPSKKERTSGCCAAIVLGSRLQVSKVDAGFSERQCLLAASASGVTWSTNLPPNHSAAFRRRSSAWRAASIQRSRNIARRRWVVRIRRVRLLVCSTCLTHSGLEFRLPLLVPESFAILLAE